MKALMLSEPNPFEEGTENHRIWGTHIRTVGFLPHQFPEESGAVRLKAWQNTHNYLHAALEKDRAARELNPKAPLKHFTYSSTHQNPIYKRLLVSLLVISVSTVIFWFTIGTVVDRIHRHLANGRVRPIQQPSPHLP